MNDLKKTSIKGLTFSNLDQLREEKEFVEKSFEFPEPASRISLNATGVFSRNKYLIDINRMGRIKRCKCTYQDGFNTSSLYKNYNLEKR